MRAQLHCEHATGLCTTSKKSERRLELYHLAIRDIRETLRCGLHLSISSWLQALQLLEVLAFLGV
jgi:hypothetical protein